MKKIASLAIALTLLGAGCSQSPSSTPEPAPTLTPEAVKTSEPTPSPAPTPAQATTPKTTTPKPTPKPAIKTITIEIRDGAFSPQIAAVNPGDTVVWKNVGKSNHTAHNLTGVLWDSGNLVPGATFSRTFPAQGRYEYGCAIHTSMKGTVIVGTVQAQP
jgi:plastocyanin